MGRFVPLLVGALAAVMGFFTRPAIVARRRGAAGAAISAAPASCNEACRGTAHQAYHEIRAQAERQVPIPSPDDAWRPGRPDEEGARLHRPLARRPLRRLRRRIGRLRHRRRRHAPTAAATATTTNINTSAAAMMRFLVFGSTLRA
ncbi:hypothetical protein [Streptomyces sp. BE133]|uniref:hypothetical protein n=1 Tax=Streptomyces sp. BE133 TaxID=3002523 RepID=UPI002E780F84|nr:hypothetical protein [Streptomyces sp. BE133]MEE1808582.1 hypothetical protein [Streptomyces sp. BE133]